MIYNHTFRPFKAAPSRALLGSKYNGVIVRQGSQHERPNQIRETLYFPPLFEFKYYDTVDDGKPGRDMKGISKYIFNQGLRCEKNIWIFVG